jgi:hypothetical protein
MRLNRRPDVATNAGPMAETARPGGRVSAGLVRAAAVTTVAASALALWALPAGAVTAARPHKLATKTSASASPRTDWTGARVTLGASVTSSGRAPTGTVEFRWAGRKLCEAGLRRGRAHCAVRLGKAGRYLIRGWYLGNATHAISRGAVRVLIENKPTPPPPAKSNTTTTITNTNPSNVDVGKPFTVNVSVASASGPAATGKVVVAPTAPLNLPASYSCTATIVNGKGSCSITPPEYGIVDYAATYSGDSRHNGSTYAGPFELGVQNVTTTAVTPSSAAAGSVTLTATVVAEGADISADNGGTGSVAFYTGDGSTVITGCAAQLLTYAGDGDNVATCTTTLAAGNYDIVAVFSGDPVNVGSTSPDDALVVK